MALLAQRQLRLLGAGLLALVVALAVHEQRLRAARTTARLPQPVAAALADWSPALVDVRQGRRLRSACGFRLQAGTVGVGHPVLPCGAKLWLAYGNRRVLTEVIDRGPTTPGAEFELTPGLAKVLGVRGIQTVRWTFARRS